VAGDQPGKFRVEAEATTRVVMKGLSMEHLLAVSSTAKVQVRVNRCRGEKDIRKDEFARNKAGNSTDEHQPNDNISFGVSHFLNSYSGLLTNDNFTITV
jgi:hypothetical protein